MRATATEAAAARAAADARAAAESDSESGDDEQKEYYYEDKYKEELAETFGITFDTLFTITNMPIKRFADFLHRRGDYPFTFAFVRDPLDRLLSAYKFWGVLHNPAPTKPTFETWLKRKRGEAVEAEAAGEEPGTPAAEPPAPASPPVAPARTPVPA